MHPEIQQLLEEFSHLKPDLQYLRSHLDHLAPTWAGLIREAADAAQTDSLYTAVSVVERPDWYNTGRRDWPVFVQLDMREGHPQQRGGHMGVTMVISPEPFRVLAEAGLTPAELKAMMQHEFHHTAQLRDPTNPWHQPAMQAGTLPKELMRLSEMEADRTSADEMAAIGWMLRYVKAFPGTKSDVSGDHPSFRNRIHALLAEAMGNEIFGRSGQFVADEKGEYQFQPHRNAEGVPVAENGALVEDWPQYAEAIEAQLTDEMALVDAAFAQGLPEIEPLIERLRTDVLAFRREHPEIANAPLGVETQPQQDPPQQTSTTPISLAAPPHQAYDDAAALQARLIQHGFCSQAQAPRLAELMLQSCAAMAALPSDQVEVDVVR